jgi:hypothetical protein
MLSLYKRKHLPKDRYEATLGKQEDVDNKAKFNAQ